MENDLSGEAKSHGEEGVAAKAGSIEGGGAGGVETGAAEEVTDGGENEDEDEDEHGGDEEGRPDEALNSDCQRDNGGDGAESGGAEDP